MAANLDFMKPDRNRAMMSMNAPLATMLAHFTAHAPIQLVHTNAAATPGLPARVMVIAFVLMNAAGLKSLVVQGRARILKTNKGTRVAALSVKH